MSDPVSYPKNFSRFYDLIYEQYKSYFENNYYLDQIGRASGKVLEAGVGTGRFYLEALEQGADIYGLDVSKNMIDVLLGKLDPNQHYRISEQSIQDFTYDFKFNLIIAPFRVMGHILEKEQHILALNNVYDHLEPGGKFIFDAFVPNLEQLIHGIDHQTDFDGEYAPGKNLRRSVSTKPDLINQQIMVNFILEWEEEDGIKTEDWKTTIRFFFRYELEHLVERSKFGDQYKIIGDFQGNELTKDSKEFIVVCTKKDDLK